MREGEQMNYTLNNMADPSGTSLMDTVRVAPARLVKIFGMPAECDEYKVSGRYVFVSDSGQIFTVYDWKETNLYDDKSAPSPAQYWSFEKDMRIHIGGKDKSDDFKMWLEKKIKLHMVQEIQERIKKEYG